MDRLEELSAIEDIKRLKAKYFRTLDTKDWSGFASVFAPDAQMDMRAELRHQAGRNAGTLLQGRDPVLVGPDVITAFVSAALPAELTSVHQGYMPEIILTGPDSASGIWAMTDYLEQAGTGIHGYGHYHETYRRYGDTWLIQTLELRRIRVDTFED